MTITKRTPVILAAALGTMLLAGCERPPVETEQVGFRGTGMVQVNNPRLATEIVVPEPYPAASQEGPRAGDIYQNLQVLGDLSITEFTRTMASITEWVSPEEGCNYCHIPTDLAADGIYTKEISRRMLQMTRNINSEWTDHVADTGVTCYTCHAGKPVPENIWFTDASEVGASNFAGNRNGQNIAAPSAGYSSLPGDPFTALLTQQDGPSIRVLSTDWAPGSGEASIMDTENTYALMMHMSGALGVNCTYCHNSNNFAGWDTGRTQRVTAWHGINMVQYLNEEYLIPLGPKYPENRLGPLGDAPKAYCSTCHAGLPKPLGGAKMAADYPGLLPQSPSQPQ